MNTTTNNNSSIDITDIGISAPEKKENTMTARFGLSVPLTEDEIIHAYQGKPGKCCCGCAGKHYYWEDAKRMKLGSLARGYEVTADETNNKKVRSILKVINENLADAEFGGTYVSYETATRLYIVYLADDRLTEKVEAENARIEKMVVKLVEQISGAQSIGSEIYVVDELGNEYAMTVTAR